MSLQQRIICLLELREALTVLTSFPRTGLVVSLPSILFLGVQYLIPAVAREICWVASSDEWRISVQHTFWKPHALMNSVLSANRIGCAILWINNCSIGYTKISLTSTWMYLRHYCLCASVQGDLLVCAEP